MTISEKQFRAMMPNAGTRLDAHWPFINSALEEGAINTPKRQAAFLAQLAHESAEYRYMEEIADGRAYEFRTDLGNTPVDDGDGPKFKGHGPIQITGHDNHLACGRALGIDLIANPRLLCLPQYGTRSAVWFWNSRKLSLLADHSWFKTITRRVNGGLNGWADRLSYYNRNRDILGLPALVWQVDEDADIRAFQASKGLVPDGAVGPATLRALAA